MIEAGRLILRRWREADAEDLYRYASDERVSELALWPRHTSLDMSREVIRQIFMPEKDTFAMMLRSTGEVIGCIGLVPEGNEHHGVRMGEREVGYWIGHSHWNKGLTTEALKAFIQVYCSQRLGLRSLLLTTDVRNKGSQRVAEKCGFRLFDRYELDGIDSLAYRLLLPVTEIRRGDKGDYPALVGIWERSVRATHTFLTDDVVNDIKTDMIPCYFPNVDLYVIVSDGVLAGFVGVLNDKIEMLFIDDCYRGKGLGTCLINHAMTLGARLVDVNEQNLAALEFYKVKGFHVIGRDALDDAGRPYPILHMSL